MTGMRNMLKDSINFIIFYTTDRLRFIDMISVWSKQGKNAEKNLFGAFFNR